MPTPDFYAAPGSPPMTARAVILAGCEALERLRLELAAPAPTLPPPLASRLLRPAPHIEGSR